MINLEKATSSGGVRLPMMLPGFPLENLRGPVSASATDQPFPVPSISLTSGPVATSGFQVLGTTNNAVTPVSDPRFIDSKYNHFFSFYFYETFKGQLISKCPFGVLSSNLKEVK